MTRTGRYGCGRCLCLIRRRYLTKKWWNHRIGLFREKFSGWVFSRNGDYKWTPIPCDLTPLDFFLWGYVKDKVYSDAAQSIQELKDKISAVIDEIEPRMCENVITLFIKRAWSCKRSCEGHLNDIVFHY